MGKKLGLLIRFAAVFVCAYLAYYCYMISLTTHPVGATIPLSEQFYVSPEGENSQEIGIGALAQGEIRGTVQVLLAYNTSFVPPILESYGLLSTSTLPMKTCPRPITVSP